MFGKQHATKKPTVRREMVLVPIGNKAASNGASKPVPQQRPKAGPPADRFQLTKRPGAKPSTVAPQKSQAPVKRVAEASRSLKRKSTTPDRVQWSSDEDSDTGSSSDSGPYSRKRIKSSVSSVDDIGPGRKLVRESAFQDVPGDVSFMHGADITSGVEAAKFTNPWEDDTFTTVELQYPSNMRRERFELKWPRHEKKDDYKPMEDITATIQEICAFYLPAPLRQRYAPPPETFNSESTSQAFEKRFKRAWTHTSVAEFTNLVDEFNRLIKPLVNDGTIRKELSAKRRLPSPLIRRILEQIYARTVSPKVESLHAYQNGTDGVYGELLPRLNSEIFQKTGLTESSVFVDLGSGVGNVVLQAALEIGCESWGIEMMPNPCALAELQAKEFPARTALWGLRVGKVNLLKGDFLEHPKMPEMLKRADVVLVNNQAFLPETNQALIWRFLDLKEGAKVVSLRPFVPPTYKAKASSSESIYNIFRQERFEYFSESVSWTDSNGEYYIATKVKWDGN